MATSNFTVSATGGFVAPNGQPWAMRGLDAGVQDALQGFPGVLTDYPGLTAIRLNVVPGSDSAASIDQVVQEYTAKGVVVEIEDHSGNGDNVAWYQQMATAYKGNSHVFLETPNEPTAAAATTAQNQIGIINAIRAAGFTGLIGVQPNGGWDYANLSTVTAAVGTAGLFLTPHIYYNGTDPNGAANYVQSDIQGATSLGLFASIDEFGNAMDGYTLDPYGNSVITAVVAANEAGQAGAVFWAMDNGNHADGTDSAFLNPNGSQLTSIGQVLQPWLSQPTTPTGGGTTPPVVTPPVTPSPNGTKITTAAANPIIDQAGNKWTLVQSASNGLQVAVNGTVDMTTANVVLLETLGGNIVQENTAGNWYSEPGPGSAWAQIAAPAAPPTPSPDGTKITTAAASPIIDQAGNKWTLVQSASNGLQVAVNGTVDITTGNVVLLETLGGNIVQENTAGNWYSEPGPGSAWAQIAAPVAVPAPITTGSGSDTLVLSISEDANLHDAKFAVSVDGKQLGSTFTATASHATAASQNFTFKGDFGTGQHAVAVNFLNAGTAAAPRNLYVNGISYDGTATGQSAELTHTGAKTFAVSGGTTPSVSETGDHGSLAKTLSQTGSYTVGGDTFVLTTGNSASVTLGTGTSQIKFIGASSATLTGGSGQATVTADAGRNKFVAGTGTLDVTGGGGKDAYVFHANGGLLKLEDFSIAKGDTLTVDKALQGAMQQTSDGQGGTMLTFGAGATHGVDIHGMATMPTTSVHWA